MRSLFVKFFLAFWLVIVLIIGAAAIGGFLYAERLQETIDDFEAGGSMQDASAALESGGRAALARWLKGLPREVQVSAFFSEGSEDKARMKQILDDTNIEIEDNRIIVKSRKRVEDKLTFFKTRAGA